MAKILITGGTGLIGRHLSHYLTGLGHEIVLLSRNPLKEKYRYQVYEWDVNKGFINERAFEGVEHIVHLAGEGIADKRWKAKRKKILIDSRINSTALLYNYIIKLRINLKSFVGASAVGFYGAKTSDLIFKEEDIAATDFLGSVCKAWEDSYLPIKGLSINTSIIRIGNVLAKDGGAYPKIARPFYYGLGSALGSGKQYMPWIHINDLIKVFEEAIFMKLPMGSYNAVASEHVTNLQFSQLLAKSLRKPFFVPNVPAFVLKLVLGEMATIVLNGSRVSNQKLINQGFQFEFPTLEKALNELASMENP